MSPEPPSTHRIPSPGSRVPTLLLQECQPSDRLEIDDLAAGDHLLQRLHPEGPRLDVLVLVLLGFLAFVRLAQAARATEVHQLVAVARRGIEGAEAFEPA